MMAPDEISALSTPDLKSHWIDCFGSRPPWKMRRATLERILICDAQWQRSGENRSRIRRDLEKVVAARSAVQDGTRLIREWNGTEHVVDVIDGVYQWNDRTWRSLSAIAREITGTRWSGPRFFGVRE
jgi:hypothetical protein